jgi:hypothetical protein
MTCFSHSLGCALEPTVLHPSGPDCRLICYRLFLRLRIRPSAIRAVVYSVVPLVFTSRRILLYTNKLYSKILHPVTGEVTMLQTSHTRSYKLLRLSNTRSYIILRASNTQGYIILRRSNTRSYTMHGRVKHEVTPCHGRGTYKVTNFHRRITHDHTRVTQQVHSYYY